MIWHGVHKDLERVCVTLIVILPPPPLIVILPPPPPPLIVILPMTLSENPNPPKLLKTLNTTLMKLCQAVKPFYYSSTKYAQFD